MSRRICLWGATAIALATSGSNAQLSEQPYVESFDAADTLPHGWSSSGFELSSSAPRSDPNCLLARGNTTASVVETERIDPTTSVLQKLTWYERRSGSALTYTLSVSFVMDRSTVVLATLISTDAANTYKERTVDLSPFRDQLLAPGRFRYAIRADGTNSTGVLRIDDLSLTIQPAYDLSVRIHQPSIQLRFVGQDVSIPILVSNNTDRTTDDAILLVLITRHPVGSIALKREHVLPPMPGQDSLTIYQPFTPSEFGRFSVAARIVWSTDQDPSNDTASMRLDAGYLPGSVLISEFMYAPIREDEPEWIEIINPGPLIIERRNLTVSDKSTQPSTLTQNERILVPFERIVLSSSSGLGGLYTLNPGQWSVERLPALNNTTSDAIVLRDTYGTTLDSVWYEPSWGEPGKSLERRDMTLPSTERSTWGITLAGEGGTPGRENSIQRLEINGTLDSLSLHANDELSAVLIRAHVRNTGRRPVRGHIRLSHRSSADSPEAPIDEVPFITIGPEGRTLSEFLWHATDPGLRTVSAVLHVEGDLSPEDDTTRAQIMLPYPEHALVVNEIMFDPVPGYCEWIEVLNTSDRDIPLHGWQTADLPSPSGRRTVLTIESDALVPAGGLGVIAGDVSVVTAFPWLQEEPYKDAVLILDRSGGLGLNAEHDGIALTDPAGRLIDSVLYSEDWHESNIDTKGRSLERIRTDIPGTSRSAWVSAPGPYRASPARENSALPPDRRSRTSVSIEPNPFSPDDDGHDDIIYIAYDFPVPTVFVRARIFDDRGRELRTVANGDLTSGKDMVRWNGLNDMGFRVQKGPYILFLEAWNDAYRFRTEEKRVIVVAR